MAKKQIKTETKEKNGFLSGMDAFFGKNEKIFLWISLALGALMSFLMFDCKVSLSGDDCDYIINAQQFIEHFTYPGGRGALYPIVISPFMIGGLRLILLKALSAVFTLLSMWLMYKAFKGKIPAPVLMPALLISNICPYIFFYASYTYSEPLFMLTQSLFLYLFSKYFWDGRGDSLQLKTDWQKYVFIGLAFLAMGLTRTIGFAVMGAVIVYFTATKQWKNLIYTLGAAVLVYFLFNVMKDLVWPDAGAPYGFRSYMAKNFYNPEQGMEDIPGFIKRIIDNSNNFLSVYLYQFMGFRSVNSVLDYSNLLTVFTYLLFAFFTVIAYKCNKMLFFTGIYLGVMYFASFFMLQAAWAQDRMIIIYYPLTLLLLLAGLYYLKKMDLNLKWIYPVFLAVLLLATGAHAIKKVDQNFPVLQENLAGNDLYGLTADWENFVKMCRWANDKLPKDAVIVSRKPSISYIYTGRDFMGIYNVPKETLNDVMQKYDSEKADFVYLAADVSKGSLMQLAPYFQYLVMPNKEMKINIDGKETANVGIYRFDKSFVNESLTEMLSSWSIAYTTDIESFTKQLRETDAINYVIINPDVLYSHLADNNVKYLLLPRIRVYTNYNTGQFINAIHQYVSFINIKYPNSFKPVHTIGKDEICELFEFLPQGE